MDIIAEDPDDRSIVWFWEEIGGVGKTALCKHICLTMKGAIYVSGKAIDIKYAVAAMDVYPKIVLMDIPRSAGDAVSWDAIESVKNGIFFSGKYEGKMITGNCPHVICFSNAEPDWSKLSVDRWKVYQIDDL